MYEHTYIRVLLASPPLPWVRMTEWPMYSDVWMFYATTPSVQLAAITKDDNLWRVQIVSAYAAHAPCILTFYQRAFCEFQTDWSNRLTCKSDNGS